MGRERTIVLGVMGAASLALHAAAAMALGTLALRSLDAPPAPAAEIVAARAAPGASPSPNDVPFVAEGTLWVDREPDRTGDPVTPAGGDLEPRIDHGAAGRGGDRTVSAPALHLASRDEAMRLTPDTPNRVDRDQMQRLRTARDRAAWEDRRATTNPTELTFIATGAGAHAERRAAAAGNPSRGALEARAAEVRGGELGSRSAVTQGGDDPSRVGMAHAGSRQSSPGLGVAEGRAGVDHRASAFLARGRPDVAVGRPSVSAPVQGRVRDLVDSQQEVSLAVRSLVHASTSGGRVGQTGRGGEGGGGAPAFGGGAGTGSHARPLGAGPGEWLDYDSRDPRLVPYFRDLHKKIDPLWQNAFPQQARYEQHQGTVILDFVVHKDGSVAVQWPPLRPSGFVEFDAKCADAIRRAGPFAPLPESLGNELHVRAPFVVKNPLID